MAAYDTYINADAYFAKRLHILSWLTASASEKTKALEEATARIDRLRFAGKAVEDDQELEFPRYYGDEAEGTETIPSDIKIACYELALVLLDGISPDLEFENLGTTMHQYSGVRVGQDTMAIFDHIAAGIPCATAWRYLMPYLANAKSIRFHRV